MCCRSGRDGNARGVEADRASDGGEGGGPVALVVHGAVVDVRGGTELGTGAPDRAADHQVLLREEVELGPSHFNVGMLNLNTTTHADFIAQLDREGLDTVRHDAESGRVHVISREYDDPAVVLANGAPRPRAKGRWFGRS